MAGEIKFTIEGVVSNSGFRDSIPKELYSIDQAAVGAHMPIVSVGTSEEDLAVGDVTTPGWVYLRNLDSTNFVTWGPKSGGSMVALGKLLPGKFAVVQLAAGVTIRWIADTAACKVQVKIYEA